MRTDTVEARLARRIRRTKRVVILRADFADLANYDRIGRLVPSRVRSCAAPKATCSLPESDPPALRELLYDATQPTHFPVPLPILADSVWEAEREPNLE